MSLSLRRGPRGDSTQRPPRVRGFLVALLVILVPLAAGFAWLTWGSSGNPPVAALAGAGAAMALAVLAYLVVRGGRSSDGRTDGSRAPVEMLQLDAAPAELVEGPVDAELVEDPVDGELVEEPSEEHVVEAAPLEDERVTLLHIRTLETALEEQSLQLAEAQAQLEQTSRAGTDVERVLLTVGALRERVNGNPESEHILNRVEAAVSRLVTSSMPGRPALPAPVASMRAALAPAAAPIMAMEPAAVPAAIAAPLASEPAAAVPVAVAAPAPAPGAAPAEPASPAAPSAPAAPGAPAELPAAEAVIEPSPHQQVAPVPQERVLPVPAPPVEVVARGSRWRRRGAA